MEEIQNISEMADLQKLIAEKTKNNIETGIYEIKNTLEALQDMQDIIAVLVKECDNRQNQIELLKKDKENLEENIEIQKEKIRNFEDDEERYKQFKDGAVNVANVLNNLQKEKEELEHDKQKLAGDRNEFERVKNDFEEEEKQLREETKNAIAPKPITAREILNRFLAYQVPLTRMRTKAIMVRIICTVIFFSYSDLSISFFISSTLNLANKYWRSWTGKR